MEDFTQGKITPYQIAAIFGIKNKKHVVEYMACRTQDMIKIKPRGEGDMKLPGIFNYNPYTRHVVLTHTEKNNFKIICEFDI